MLKFGKQFVIVLEQCDPTIFISSQYIVDSIKSIADGSGLHIIKYLEHSFEPEGLTIIMILSQSHLVVHTWPETFSLIIDLFVCQSQFVIQDFVDKLVEISGASSCEAHCSFER